MASPLAILGDMKEIDRKVEEAFGERAEDEAKQCGLNPEVAMGLEEER